MSLSATSITLVMGLVATLVSITIFTRPYQLNEPFIPLTGRIISEVKVDGITRLCHDGDETCLLTGLSDSTPSDPNQIVYLKDIPTIEGGKELSKFRTGCGISHATNSAGEIVLFTRVQAGNGLYEVPECSDGEAIIIEANISSITSQLDVEYISNNYITDRCGFSHAYNNATNSIEMDILISGNDGITVDACTDGGPQQIGLNGTAVVNTLDIFHFVSTVLADTCGLMHEYNSTTDMIHSTVQIAGFDGIEIYANCSFPGDPIEIHINGTEVIDNFNLNYLVDSINITYLYEAWFADGCGITTDLTGGLIYNNLDVTSTDGSLSISACNAGDPRDFSLNTVTFARGGTGQTTAPLGNLLVGGGSGWNLFSPGLAGQVVTVNGAGTNLIWTTPDSGVTSVSGSAYIGVTPGDTPTVSLLGTIPITLGGTGLNSIAAGGRLLISHPSNINTLNTISPGSLGQVLTWSAGNTATWQATAAPVDVCTVVCNGATTSWDVTTTGNVDIIQTDASPAGIRIGAGQTFGAGAQDTVLIGGRTNTIGGLRSVSLGGYFKSAGTGPYSFYGPVETAVGSSGSYLFFGTGMNNQITNTGNTNTILNGVDNVIGGSASGHNAIYGGFNNRILSTSTNGYNVVLSAADVEMSSNSVGNVVVNGGFNSATAISLVSVRGVTILSPMPSYGPLTMSNIATSTGNNVNTAYAHNLHVAGGRRYSIGYEDINGGGAAEDIKGNFITYACFTAPCAALFTDSARILIRTDNFFLINGDRKFQLSSQAGGNYPLGMIVEFHIQQSSTDVRITCPGAINCLCGRTGVAPYDCVNTLAYSTRWNRFIIVLTLKDSSIDYWTYMFTE